MKSILAFAVASILGSCGYSRPSTPYPAPPLVRSSTTCFHGWVSETNRTIPTGNCSEESKDPLAKTLYTRVEIDYPTQTLFIHGALTDPQGQPTYFRFNTTRCQDIEDGWTVVEGVASSGEKYALKHRAVEALLAVELAGQTYQAKLVCRP